MRYAGRELPEKEECPPSANERTRIVIAEDFVLIQEGIRLLLEPECDIVAAVEDAEAALAAVAAQNPDILLVDVSLPGGGGFSILEKLTELRSAVKVIFVTAHNNPRYSDRAFEMGAKGYVLKGAMRSELLPAIRAVMSGGVYRSPLIPG